MLWRGRKLLTLTRYPSCPSYPEKRPSELTGYQVLGIALTDTFGTPNFLEAFKQPIPTSVRSGDAGPTKTFAQVFMGVRQDSGDPALFVQMVRDFYDRQDITEDKVIVFSDSLNIEKCLEYKIIAEKAGFRPVFGVGTFLTSTWKPLVIFLLCFLEVPFTYCLDGMLTHSPIL